MKREEAIKTLNELLRETNDPWYEEVYNMAIEALSKPTCEKYTELISKEDAIQKFKIHKFYGKEGDVEFRREEIEAIHHAINSIPLREAIPCEVADKIGEENERLIDTIGQLEERIQSMEARVIIARMEKQNE